MVDKKTTDVEITESFKTQVSLLLKYGETSRLGDNCH